jgi:UDP-GlcNAc:undecaprenyl-phosphate/decaprenyl-phosphate GlcNAc-1-phosphate transferase
VTYLPWWAYIIVFAVPALLTILFTPIALSIAHRLKLFDLPNPGKAHKSPVPFLGGAAIVAAFAVIVLGATLIRPPKSGLADLAAVMGIALVLSAMGLIDDIRGLSPWLRLAVEAAAGVGVWALGVRTHLHLLSSPIDGFVTVAWVVGVTNAFNLLDNMDGLSAGVAAIAAGFLFVVAFLNGQFLVASLAIALAGCAIGFLRHNFHPARIYMGDAGSLFIGFLIAVLSLQLRTHSATRLSFLIPFLIVGVPLFDTSLVTITRLSHRRSPFDGGQDHVSHRLVRLGIPVRGAVIMIYGSGFALGWFALIVMRVDRSTGFMLVGLVITVAVTFGALLALIPVRQNPKKTEDPAAAGISGVGEGAAQPSVEGPWATVATLVGARFVPRSREPASMGMAESWPES